LRNYLHFNLLDQADKLIAKTTFPESAGNNQFARYHYYLGTVLLFFPLFSLALLTSCLVSLLGKIRAIQLDYTESHKHLMQAIRKAPQAPMAAGFQQAVGSSPPSLRPPFLDSKLDR